jgi:DGQHR domain-containing protein
MPRHPVALSLEEVEELQRAERPDMVSYTASLVTQGKYRFYTLTMPSDVLAQTCSVDMRAERTITGFQRRLDLRRAKDIAQYIDMGFGTIPGSIVLSAQSEAEMQYFRKTRTLNFKKHPRAFLILDGQHRVYGFHLAQSPLRVPVVIYNGLSKADEVSLFIDINTKQRPVPNELLLDIKRLAETETSEEALLRAVFDLFDKETASPLFGIMSPSEKKKGRISRVTFNAALKAIFGAFEGSDAEYVYKVLSSYLQAWLAGLRTLRALEGVPNPTVFRAIFLLFPSVAARVSDRHNDEYTVENFNEVLQPLFKKLKAADILNPAGSHIDLSGLFKRRMESGFAIGRGRTG